MADLGTLSGGAVEIALAGERFLVSPKPLKVLGELQAWFKRTIPGPIARAAEEMDAADRAGVRLSRWAREMAMDAAARATTRWPPRVGSLEWLDAIDRAELGHHVIRVALAEHHPDVAEAESMRLADGCTPDELNILVGVLFWGLDPKALRPAGGGPVATPAPSPTTPPPGATTGTP
jgi:hypothetical protein